tara:strand:+ start:229 stop:1002 length:774 start_codon:yes stop_codon:yes gene_type:complete
MKKIGLVDLKGGFGNQIFQIAFALFLKDYGLNVFIDKRFFKLEHPFPRNLEIDPKIFGFKEIEFKNNRIFFFLNTFFEEKESFNLTDFKFLNRFVGYYQDLKFIDLNKAIISEKLGIYKNKSRDGLAAIHLRKTDYETINQLLSDKYYEYSINSMLEINNDIKFDIYTDSNELIINKNIFKNINNIYYPKKNETAIEVFQNLSNYQNYIIANSSFSALAAYLSKYENKTIFYPDPWFRDSIIQLKEIPKSWNPIKNF